ncbi:MAG: efflux RND transporter periplasmic adaptor subunit [Anaerolineales bacterium]|jgi:multidrug resistance efflux pump|nr:efflux RND transporter periplasmic adaptor subunit [Anaerolineales bacterium]
MKSIHQSLLALFTILLLLTGCQVQSPEATAAVTQEAPSILGSGAADIVIEGRLVPRTSATLSFTVTGQVAEVLVAEGELVETGQVIGRLGGQAPIEAALKTAELELLAAQQALQSLDENQAAIQNQALAELTAARQAVQDAQRYLDSITGERLQNEVDGAQAQVVIAENRLESARDNYEEYAEEPDTDTTRASYRLRLTEAQRAYDEAVRQLDDLQGDGYAFLLQQAQNTLKAANNRLELAETNHADASQGPDPDAVEAAKARVTAAQANLSAAQANQEQLDLRAPMAGTLVESTLRVGEVILAGQPVAQIADLSDWIVETSDLTEMDVVNIAVGQTVQIAADALPGLPFTGSVLSIRNIFQEVRGDVTYTARISLPVPDPRLRWGMTLLVTFTPVE